MQKVTVLCLAKDKEGAVARLRELGVLHVTPARTPAGSDLESARQRLERARTALALLPVATDARDRAYQSGLAVDEVIARTHRLAEERRELEQELSQLEGERRAELAFGEFDPDQARALRAAGVWLRLYQLDRKAAAVQAPPGASLQVLGREGGMVAAVLVGPPEATLPAREIPLPARSLSSSGRAIAEKTERKDAIARELADLGRARPAVVAAVHAARDDLQLLEAKAGMGEQGPLAWIAGFCPTPMVERVQSAARDAGWAVATSEPAAGDSVPTQLAGPPWVRQLHAVLEGLGITPGYGEPDVSAVFLIFLVLFAGMLIGDAGYGALILLGVLVARRKLPRAPAQPLRLLRTIGVATMAWGAITGTWFAIPALPPALDALRVAWLAGADKGATTRNVMSLCFFLGALHLTIAHLWAALRSGKSLAALAQLGWIGTTWLMFFVARTMVLQQPFPAAIVPVAILAVTAIVLFMTPPKQLKREWFNHAMLPLTLVSSFVDVVSYVRLFAVGTAGVAVATAFNGMAADIGAEGGLSLVPAALVAIFGHTLNLLLCAMGVLVHGVRLNTLEFSAHLGMQWSGIPYEPLRRRDAAAAIPDSDR